MAYLNPSNFGLSEGCLRSILNGVKPSNPRVQLLNFKEIGQKSGAPSDIRKYRLLISDGQGSYPLSMLASQHSHFIESGELQNFSIFNMQDYVLNNSNNATGEKKILIINNIAIVHDYGIPAGKIGNPQPIGGNQEANGTPAGGMPQPQQNSYNPMQNSPGGVKRPFPSPSNVNNGPPKRAPFQPQQHGQNNQQFGQGNFSSRPQNPGQFHGGNNAGGGNTSYNAGGGGGGGGSRYGGGGGGMMPTDTEGFDPAGPPPMNILPINAVNIYGNRWTIRAKVEKKDPIREWSNAKGQGRVFGMWLKDETGVLKASCFTNEVDKFHPLIQEGRAYYIRGGTLKVADTKFARGNMYDLAFNSETQIRLCEEDIAVAPVSYTFTKINQIPNMQVESVIDVLGIIKEVPDIFGGTSKAGKDFRKRDVEITDETGFAIKVTLWNESADNFEGHPGDRMVVKRAKITDFNGSRSLSILGDFQVNPSNIAEAVILLGWWQASGKNQAVTSISGSGGGAAAPLLTIEQATTNFQNSPQTAPLTYSTLATIMRITRPEKAMYKACTNVIDDPGRNGRPPQKRVCNKKLADSISGAGGSCESCQVTGGAASWRYMLSAEVADCSGSTFVTIFQEQAEKILGRKAEEMGHLMETDQTTFRTELTKLHFTSWLFKMRCSMSMYQDQSQIKHQVSAVEPVDPVAATKLVVDALAKLRVGA